MLESGWRRYFPLDPHFSRILFKTAASAYDCFSGHLQKLFAVLKVLHIYRTYFPDPPGGSQEAIRQIMRATRSHGVESRVFTLSPTPKPAMIALAEGEVVRARSYAAPASCDIGGGDAFRTFRYQADWADVLNFHFPWPFGDLLRLLGNRNKPAVMTYHSDIVRQQYLGMIYRPLMRLMFQSMDVIVPTSDTYARTSTTLNDLVPRNKIRAVPLGIADFAGDVAKAEDEGILARRFGLAPGEKFLLFVGVHRYYKGLHSLVAAAPGIQGKIIIAGSGPEREKLMESSRALHADNVIFPGQITDSEKRLLLKHCAAFVLPSHLRSEAFGMVLVEAAMFGKPMITCEIGSGTSFVNHHLETGFVVDPERPEQLREKANALLADDTKRATMGIAARQRYERLFSDVALGQSYSELYRFVTSRG